MVVVAVRAGRFSPEASSRREGAGRYACTCFRWSALDQPFFGELGVKAFLFCLHGVKTVRGRTLSFERQFFHAFLGFGALLLTLVLVESGFLPMFTPKKNDPVLAIPGWRLSSHSPLLYAFSYSPFHFPPPFSLFYLSLSPLGSWVSGFFFGVCVAATCGRYLHGS